MLQNNISQQAANLSRLSDYQLSQELSSPSGAAPQYLVMSEMQKRQQMRQGGVGAGLKPPIKQQLLANSAVGASPTMPEAAAPANVQSPPVPAGPQMVANNQAPQGGIPALAQMSRVAGVAQAKPVGYDQAMPPAYAQGGIVGMIPYADGGQVNPDGTPYDPNYVPEVSAVNAVVHRNVPAPVVHAPQIMDNYQPAPLMDMTGSHEYSAQGPYTTAGLNGTSALGMFGMGQSMQNAGMAQSGLKQNQGIVQNSRAAMDAMGGQDTFTKPYDPAIGMYRQQVQSQNPISMALMKAGAAMMSAPNGTVLSGLGVGLNSGVDAYTAAQAQQRAIQDKLVQAQMAQGNALAGGYEKATGYGLQQGQQQSGDWNSEANRMSELVGKSLLVPQQNYKNQSDNDQFDAELAVKQMNARANLMGAGAQNKNADNNTTYKVAEDINNTQTHAYTSALSDYWKLLDKTPDQATPTEKANAEAYASNAATIAGQRATLIHKTGGMNIMRYDAKGNLVPAAVK